MGARDHRPEFRSLQEKTILNVLYHIRAEIVRGDLDGIEHVDALISARGADPEGRAIPSPRPRRFKRRTLSRAILTSLRDGPATAHEIAARLSNEPDTPRRVGGALRNLRKHGLVAIASPKRGRIRQVWRLAP